MKLPRYPAYKDSGVKWIGFLPEHWTVQRLAYMLSEPPCYGVLVPDLDPDGVPMVRITDMKRGQVNRDDLVVISKNLSDQYSRTITRRGDVLLSVVGTIGEVVHVDSSLENVNLSRAVARIQPRTEDVDPRFLGWVLQSRAFNCYVDLVCVGTAQRVLNMGDLSGYRGAFPPREEQSAIAAFLDRETAKIDALIDEQERLLELLAEKRQAVISHAVTKGLNTDAPMKDSGVAWLGEVPAHWRLPPLSMRYEAVLGKMLDSAKITGQSLVPYLRNIDVQWGKVNLDDLPLMDIDEQDYDRFTVRDGDLLVCEGGEVGRAAIVRVGAMRIAFQKALHRLRALSPQEHPPYLFYTFNWAAKAGAFAGEGQATIAHLTGEQLRRYRFPTPPYVEQVAIAKHLSDVCSRFDKATEQVRSALGLLRERRSALIAAAVTGQLDVRRAA